MKVRINNLLERIPEIDGLEFRGFQGESDFPLMLDIIEAAASADHDEESMTVFDIKNDYKHLKNSNPQNDMCFAEVNGTLVAYSRVDWSLEEASEDTIYSHFVHIRPEWRNQGIEDFMIDWCENRLREISKAHPHGHKQFFQTYSNELKPWFNQIIERKNYQPVRYFIEMSRSLKDIPLSELPEGVETRPVKSEDVRKIWDASIEAFRDHWGFTDPGEESFKGYKESKYFQPYLWQVAWHGDDVVGSVLNFIDRDYNKKYNKKRGWTEEITTHREWRRKGIARALIIRSMHTHKALGMKEIALGVDTNNPTGALKLYTSLGYHKDKTMMTYRKEFTNS